jgi:hypothetical protein
MCQNQLNRIRLLTLVALLSFCATARAQDAATEPAPATTQHSPNAMKVGWVVSQSTFEYPQGHGLGTRFDSVTAIHKRFVDRDIELYALIEPGTETNEDIATVVRDNFETDHVINGADPTELAKLDVIVCSRAWNVKDEMLDAITKAVEGGVGLLQHMPIGTGDEPNEAAQKLDLITDPEPYFQRPLTDCRIVSEHPILSGLRGKLEDGKTQISALHGARGIVHGTPLIVLEDELNQLTNVDEQGKPKDDKGAKPPADQKLFCPLFVGELGKGRIVMCQWDSLPKAVVEHSNGRFYVHCIQWLAKREVK